MLFSRNETGKVYGKLTVGEKAAEGEWLCKCECGVTLSVRGSLLRTGEVIDCGACVSTPEPVAVHTGVIGEIYINPQVYIDFYNSVEKQVYGKVKRV